LYRLSECVVDEFDPQSDTAVVKDSKHQITPDSSLWENSPTANLVRYKPSGVYFVRARIGGKLIRKSLKTTVYSVAVLKLGDQLKEHRKIVELHDKAEGGKMTFGAALELYRAELKADAAIKPRTREYYEERIAALLKSWPGLNATDVRKITTDNCAEWSARFKVNRSATAYNNTVGVLRKVIDVAVKKGVRYGNPAMEIKKAKVTIPHLDLPSRAEFLKFVDAIDRSGVCSCYQAADLVRFLAYGGFRKKEAAGITRADLKFNEVGDGGEIVVRDTKNGETRIVPMIPPMVELLKRILGERPDESADTPIMKVKECQISMDKAAKKIGMQRITHHDLRHLFATTCIESGVDVPTVARWLGHRDGGVLAMRVYTNHRKKHSEQQARRVVFSDTVAANVVKLSETSEQPKAATT
jgi:integrase